MTNDIIIPTSDEILQYANENDIIDVASICDQIIMEKDKKFLAMHPFRLWEARDGQWNTYFPDEKKGRVRRHRKTKEELEQLIIEFWKQQTENPTFKDVFEDYEQRKLRFHEIIPSSYSRHMRTYKTHCEEFGQRRIKDIKPAEIKEFLKEQIADHNLTSKAFQSLKTLVKGTFERAEELGLISFSVELEFAKMKFSKNAFKKVFKEDYEEVFSEEELDLLIPYLIEHLDMRNIGLLLALVTGIRIGEIAALKHSDIDGFWVRLRRTETKYEDENGKTVYDIREYTKTDAGMREAIIPSDYEWLIQELQKLSPKSEFIFTEDDGTTRMITERFRKRQGAICNNLGIYHKSPHKSRKTYSTILFDYHVDNRLVTTQLGWCGVGVGESHYHRNRRSMEARQQIISSIPDLQLPDNNHTANKD